MKKATADHAEALRQAVFALRGGRPQEAEWIAADLLKRSPREPRAQQIFGCALLQQGKVQDAIGPLKQAASRTHDPEVATQYAMALQQAGHDEQAIEVLQRIVARNPPFPPACVIYGGMLTSLDRRDEAIEVVKRGLSVTPHDPELLAMLGNNLMRRGDRPAATAAYRDALTHAPGHADALHALGRALQIDGEIAQAAEIFRRLRAVEPGGTAAQIGLGICLLDLGETEAAFDLLRTAARSSTKAFAEVVSALLTARRGRFWLRRSDAERFLRDGG